MVFHINVLELTSAVSTLRSVAPHHSSVRFASFLIQQYVVEPLPRVGQPLMLCSLDSNELVPGALDLTSIQLGLSVQRALTSQMIPPGDVMPGHLAFTPCQKLMVSSVLLRPFQASVDLLRIGFGSPC
jgi:hypothetical protein